MRGRIHAPTILVAFTTLAFTIAIVGGIVFAYITAVIAVIS